ncbi:MAG: hypothetical protein HY553_05650 [Elusimicrobia bacterium]|nr:hypothetical protein [Elusimicrobiota bacterium]
MRLRIPALALVLTATASFGALASGKAVAPVELVSPFQPIGVAPAPLAPAAALAPALSPGTNLSTLALGRTLPVRAAASKPGAARAQPIALGTGAVDDGRVLFDGQRAQPAEGLISRFKAWAGLGDRVPSWPGKAGDVVKLGGMKVELTSVAGDGGGSRVWNAGYRDFVVKLIHPEFMSLPHYAGEAAILRSLAKTDIPHAKLLRASADGSVMIKERVEGDPATRLFSEGLERRHLLGLAELAARLIRNGVSADLVASNLVWDRWRSKYKLYDAGGIVPAGPEAVLRQLLTAAGSAPGFDRGRFFAALRGRLGPDSEPWVKVEHFLRSDPSRADDLSALRSHDAALPAAPRITFGPGEPGLFSNTIGGARDIVKALGYDPATAKPKFKLHGDDPGKLNTVLYSVEPPGKRKVVVKQAAWDIVRDEIALRRVARRLFGEWFDTPSAIGVNLGFDSYLVMEHASGGAAYGRQPLTRAQRAAIAIFVNAFGIGDVNGGNVLFPSRAKPVLIDFEQALGRREPIPGRLPDERIATEMPWMDRYERNPVELYAPAIREWRRVLTEPKTQAGLKEDFVAAGYSAREAEALLGIVQANTADLDWTLTVDAEFVDQFVARNAR